MTMAKGFFGKVLSLIGVEQQDEQALEADEEAPEGGFGAEDEIASGLDSSAAARRRGSVVAIPAPKAMRVVVVEPVTFDEVQAIAMNLRNRRPVIVNLERADRDIARRIVDFLSGATYALGGAMQRVGGAIFLFAPHNVDVAAQSNQGGGDGPDANYWTPK
jgi:cell division inhibitor SepF